MKDLKTLIITVQTWTGGNGEPGWSVKIYKGGLITFERNGISTSEAGRVSDLQGALATIIKENIEVSK